MSYIQNTLLDNEKVVYQERQHWVIFLSSVFFFVVANIFYWDVIFLDFTDRVMGLSVHDWVALAFFIMAAFQFMAAYASYVSSEFAVTDRRVLMKMGWIRRFSVELFLGKIEAVLVEQTLVGRLLGYGRVVVVGTGGSRDPFLYIANPLRFRHAVQQQMDLLNSPSSS